MPHRFPAWLKAQLKAGQSRELTRGEVLFRAGDPITKLYLLQTGTIHLVRPLSHGELLTIHRAMPGTMLAEGSLFATYYHCDAVAERDSTLLCYNRELVQQHLRSNPGFAEHLCGDLSGEILALRTKLELSHIQSAVERLLAWIRLHADPDTATLTLDRPLQSIASELGLARETLYRSLKNLEQKQIIRREPGKIVLLLHLGADGRGKRIEVEDCK